MKLRGEFYELAGAKILGKFEDPSFSFCNLSWVHGGMILQGGKHREITRGPRKGRRTWEKPLETVIVSDFQAKELAEVYAAAGGCCECMSTGEVFVSWSQEEGKKMKECPVCNGTGKAVKL